MRLAVLSDVHGNLPALEAVLADVQAQGVPDLYWVLGDLAAFCPWPSETIARLRALPNVSFLQGNTDRYLVTGRRPVLPIHTPEDWAAAPTRLAERDASFRWTVERLSWADYEFLRDLPTRLEMDVGAGSPRPYGRVVAFHANPVDDEANVFPDTTDDQVRPYLAGMDVRLMLYGHTHRPVDRIVDGVRLVNGGSVGFSLDGDPRPAYALLDFEGDECTVTLRRVEYDHETVIAELERVAHPARMLVARLVREGR